MLRTVADQPSLWEAILPDEAPASCRPSSRGLTCCSTTRCSSPRSCRSSTRGSVAVDTDGDLSAAHVLQGPLPARVRVVVPGGVGLDHLASVLPDRIDQKVPHPTTLMKLTTRCGSAAVDGLNEALLAKAVEAKVVRTAKIRIDTTVVPANVAYPTDSGLLARAVNRIATTARRIRAAGGATRTKLRDRSRAAGRKAHDLNAKLRTRNAAAERRGVGGGATQEPGACRLADTAVADAVHLLANAKRAIRTARRKAADLADQGEKDATAGRKRGRLVRAVNDLSDLLDATRVAGTNPAADGRHHPDGATRGGQPARPRRPTDPEGPARQAGRIRPQSPGVSTTPTASSSTTTSNPATPPTHPL